MSAMIQCWVCGKEDVAANADACPNCGNTDPSGRKAAAQEQAARERRRIKLLGFGLAIAAAIAMLIDNAFTERPHIIQIILDALG